MTILRPFQGRRHRQFLIMIFVLILIGSLFYIFQYNNFVSSRYQLKILKQDMIGQQALNADLKNALYKIIDASQLEKLALDKGLVLERNPEYLSSSGSGAGVTNALSSKME